MSAFRAEILACASEVLGPDVRLGDGSSLFAAGRLDSIVSVEWLSVLEDRFGVQLDDEAFFGVRSIDELVTLIAAAAASEPVPESGLAIVRDSLGSGVGEGRSVELVLIWCQPEPWPPASWREEARTWPLVTRLAAGFAPRTGERVGVFGCDGVILAREAPAGTGDAVAERLAAAGGDAFHATRVWGRRLAATAAPGPSPGDGAWLRLAAGAIRLPMTRLAVTVPGQMFLADGPALGGVLVTEVDRGRMIARLAGHPVVPSCAALHLALRGGHRVSCRMEVLRPTADADAILVARLDDTEAAETVSRALASAAEVEIRAEFARVRALATPDASTG